jgi:hypothetical protein
MLFRLFRRVLGALGQGNEVGDMSAQSVVGPNLGRTFAGEDSPGSDPYGSAMNNSGCRRQWISPSQSWESSTGLNARRVRTDCSMPASTSNGDLRRTA